MLISIANIDTKPNNILYSTVPPVATDWFPLPIYIKYESDKTKESKYQSEAELENAFINSLLSPCYLDFGIHKFIRYMPNSAGIFGKRTPTPDNTVVNDILARPSTLLSRVCFKQRA